MKLGVGIVTYKRPDDLRACLDAVSANTDLEHALVVADDGSEDGTTEYLRNQSIPHVTGRNRGIAWNKNRALFYLSTIEKCDVILLLEDDTLPERPGWERPWIASTLRHGHLNLASPGVAATIVRGAGTAEDPYLAYMISAQCSSFSSNALSYVGYMDPRFRGFGYEHVEHSTRFLRAGYGGELPDRPGSATHFYVVKAALRLEQRPTFDRPDASEKNRLVYEAIGKDPIHRAPWSSDDEMRAFRSEIAEAIART